ncbi:hypothetical protein [Cupriavidus metallidurans]|uniref:hypothetical protein n=1 Tax=Cupriavidus metallidurans TaxID=119219 RepID=UPI00055BDEF3|nr:hypothetical protein [Cupriavidus metallidurans]
MGEYSIDEPKIANMLAMPGHEEIELDIPRHAELARPADAATLGDEPEPERSERSRMLMLADAEKGIKDALEGRVRSFEQIREVMGRRR